MRSQTTEAGVRVADRLRARGAASWQAAIDHPMVAEIGAGTLPKPVFRGYFEQNVRYLEDYARAIALVLARTSDADGLRTLCRFLGQIVENELPANLAFLDRLGGTPAAELSPTTYAYTRHLLDVCSRHSAAAGLAAILPCQWSYGELARRLATAVPAEAIYADWIGMFANTEYDALVESTTGLLDRLATDHEEELLAAVFDRSTRYELQFWQAAYESGES